MKKVLVLIICIVLSQNIIKATEQMSDILILSNKEYCINHSPMYEYFQIHTNLLKLTDYFVNTGLMRGYFATYIINNNKMYLKDIKVSSNPFLIKEINKNGMLHIDWFTGILSTHDRGFGSNIIIEIKSGVVNKILFFTGNEYDEFIEKQFLLFKNTPAYKAEVFRLCGGKCTNTTSVDYLIKYRLINKLNEILEEK